MTSSQLSQNKDIQSQQGIAGEQFALAYEQRRLPGYLHEKIVRFGGQEIAVGYDILSFETPVSLLPDRYIEVKTFRGHPHFFWSEGEIAAARKYAGHYYLYLIDIDRIADPTYEPQIISNPVALFEGDEWSHHPVQYAFSLNADDQIPADWDTSTVLVGCYKSQEHLQWILSHQHYNVRAEQHPTSSIQKSLRQIQSVPQSGKGATTVNGSESVVPGTIMLSAEVLQARYLLLYSAGSPASYTLHSLSGHPNACSRQQLQALGYPDSRCPNYLLHPIDGQLASFYIDLPALLRNANPKDASFVGTPLYLSGAQLRPYMRKVSNKYIPFVSGKSLVADHPARAFQPWTSDQDALLLRMFTPDADIDAIAIQLQRSRGGVIARLKRLGQI